MRSILILSLLSCFFAAYEAKIFSKCELAHVLKAAGMDGYYGYSLEDFQVSRTIEFMDDNISDDISCAKRVVKDPNGMSAWVAWVKHCKGKDLSTYLASCKL
nr:lysozyme C, milk isozyme-like [Manis javanica]